MTPEIRFHLRATLACCGLLLLGTGTGWILVTSGMLPAETGDPIAYESQVEQTLTEPPWDHFVAILWNNLKALFALLAGIVTLGLLPLLQILHIGLTIGIEAATKLQWGIPAHLYAAALVPHAIPELTAFALGGSLSVRALWNTLRYLRGGSLILPEELRAALWTACLALTVLILAAGVEAWGTPGIARNFLSVGIR